MKNLNNLLLFFFFLGVSIGTWYLLSSVSGVPPKSNSLSTKLEDIRSLGIGDNPVEIRRAVEIPENIKEEMQSVLENLKEGLKDDTKKYQESEALEIVKMYGSFGERASFASSAILKLFEDSTVSNNVDSTYFQTLLALVRITKTPEIAESSLRNKCFDEEIKDSSRLYACIGLLRLGLEIPKEYMDEVNAFSSKLLSEDILTVNSWIEHKVLVTENTNPVINHLCLISPILKDIQLTQAQNIFDIIIQSDLNSHVKIATLDCAIDLAPKKPAILDLVSHTMQFASEKSVRKQALLSLLHIGSERSLELAKAYGHKFINGEAPPEVIIAHPFREWAIKEGAKNSSSQ